MVKLEEVQDEEFAKEQPGEDDWDTDSSLSDDASIASDTTAHDNETLLDRVHALKDIIPPTSRRKISAIASIGYSWTATTLGWGSKALWVVSTSALLLGVPWALAFAEEQQLIEMEREAKMQQSASDLLTGPKVSEQGQPVQAAL